MIIITHSASRSNQVNSLYVRSESVQHVELSQWMVFRQVKCMISALCRLYVRLGVGAELIGELVLQRLSQDCD